MIRFVAALLLLGAVSCGTEDLDAEVQHQCVQRCPLQNRTDVGHYDLGCGYECNVYECTKGCKLWKEALQSSCKTACNGTAERLPQRQLHCVMGCNDAAAAYFGRLRGLLGTPPAPALVADSLSATSLRLEWRQPEEAAARDRLLQWRYEEPTVGGAAWQYCRNQTWTGPGTVLVGGLQPYTKYRFRVALLLGHHIDPIVSAQSVVISTLPSGPPASPPAIVRAVPIDSTRVSVTWEPGPFPHGPLLSYVLRVTENHPQGHTALKDIQPENNFYMFQNLVPNRNYTVSVSMRNSVGLGPAAQVLVSTPPQPTIKNAEQPVLIIAAQQVVIQQGTDLFDEPVLLYSSQHYIRGIAVHIAQKLLFVSDSTGNIYRMPLKKQEASSTEQIVILSSKQMNCEPMDLSIDWLNGLLYILCEVQSQQQKVWQIVRSEMDGKGITVAIAGLRTKPHHIEVDPYNGFLFWSADNYPKVGLYRLDLANISNGIKHDVIPKLLLQERNLGAFTVDYAKYRLIVSSQGRNTVNSVSFDGSEVINLRPNINKSRFEKVLSLAIANDKFYWADGAMVYYEDYHPSCNCYFHNTYPYLTGHSYKKVIVNLPSAQPIPVPVNPPTSVQAIFGTYLAKTSWQPPHLLGFQGKGAWQNWSYKIEVKNLRKDSFVTYKSINSTSYTINNLEADTEYLIKVAAYANGRGPWSSEFKGMSLRIPKDDDYPVILWSASEGLLKSDATGENVQAVLHKSMMRHFFFTNVAWYQDILYLVTNTSQIYWYNTTTHDHGQLIDIESVQSVAVDWIGKKLYWSNPKQQLIIRGNLNGAQQEPLPILTFAKELNIDAVQAYLYWSTGYAVECAHLNGADRLVYHHAELFTGKKVVGLTLDMDYKAVYWIVRSSEGSNLYKAPMAGYLPNEAKVSEEMVSSLQKPNMQGPLCYFNNRLLWLQDNKNAAISDLHGKNIAKISGKSMSGLTMVSVVDSSLHVWPNVSEEIDGEISTIPEAIDKHSIRVNGSWKSFNITWKPVQNVNFGTVFYEVSIKNEVKNESTSHSVTTLASLKYSEDTQPFTKLHVSIRAFTYWGSSVQVQAKVYSPPSTPSAPCNLRSYVTHTYLKGNRVATVTFRWDPPKYSNGVIEGYKIYCWNLNNTDNCGNITVPPSEVQIVLSQLEDNETYYFQVQAFTAIGFGDITDTVSANTSIESPLPTLLIASSDSISMQDVDIDKNYPILHGIMAPTEVSYLIKENKVFWLNEMHELLVFHLSNSTKYSKILDVNGNATSLTIDWVERTLYFVQTKASLKCSVISKVDLNHIDRGVTHSIEVLRRDAIISKLEVSPFTRKLYWTELQYNGSYRLMKSNTNGTQTEPFFNQDQSLLSSEGEPCDCPWDFSLEKTFSLDHSNIVQKPILTFIDSDTYTIRSADKDGCRCNIVADSVVISNSRPIHTLKSDFKMLYWTNIEEKLLYSVEKNNNQVLKKTEISAQDILIYGMHMHPYPPLECLIPAKSNITVTLKKKMAHMLVLDMPQYRLEDGCPDVSIASPEYTVYYRRHSKNDTLEYDRSCRKIKTFNRTLKVQGLQPFSRYVFFVSISNYYADLHEEEALISEGVVFETAAGMPSKPRDVTATVLNPTKAEIQWLRPKELNGRTISYLVHWETEVVDIGIRQTGEQKVFDQSETNYSAVLHNLSPNVTYSVWVRACSETNESCSESKKIHITTFPEPQNITLVEKTAYSLKVRWEMISHVENYTMQFCEMRRFENWIDIKDEFITEEKETTVIAEITGLNPKTQYKFRLNLWYPKYAQEYVWPSETRFIFETEGDRPSPPGVPNVQHVKGDVYQVWWEPAKDNGSPISLYLLEGLKLPVYRSRRSANRTAWYHNAPSIEEPENEWESFYNGTENSWIISGLSDKFKYSFRVSALNSYGWSDPSEESIEFDIYAASQIAEGQNPTLVYIAICVPLVFCALFIPCFICCCWKCNQSKKDMQISISNRGPDAELATLRELPRRGNFIHNTNILYVSSQVGPNEQTLPHIRRDQITLTKFLGSGAFGEVFEGVARGLPSGDTKVAIKTLRTGASKREKSDFLKEAQLMGQFKHEHILQLLGVCLDNDPHFIIMELMQGGDLLTYLRSSRNPSSTTPSLTLLELLKMCVDVAKGCCYLEETHFVHRDLACRNCLVSSTDPAERIVKIGDFGLARDIYKNDYYRKEGEALLPIRWMAPESLLDGVFTCQSDVWAFGVLLWEIMTLGQQPYPAISNVEILRYLREGERLGKPNDCPDLLYALMLKCWDAAPDERPTFKYCLGVIQQLHADACRKPVTGAHEGQYISTVLEHCDGVSNEAYFREENCNDSGSSWKSNDTDSTPFLSQKSNSPQLPQQIPNYLELLYDDSDCPPENDGYEVPNKPDWEKNKSLQRTPSSSSKISESALTKSDISANSNFMNISKDLTIENILKDSSTFTEKQDSGFAEECLRK